MLETMNLKEMKDNVRRVVESLDVCWRCQNVTECHRHVLGNLVLVWLCSGCRADMDQLHSQPRARAKQSRKVLA